MTLLLLVVLSGPPPIPSPPPWAGGRVYTSPRLHVGIRPAVFVSSDEAAAGITIQVSTVDLL